MTHEKLLFTLSLILTLTACRPSSQVTPGQEPMVNPTPSGVSEQCAQPDLPKTVAYKTVVGVDPNLLSLDIYLPAAPCHAPVVMWVHGGGYMVGDKGNQIEDKVSLFNQQGWIFVSVNYRLTKPGEPFSAQYPDHYLDVAAAVAWVQTNIIKYGGDAGRIALLGHSAGADILSNVAVNPTYLGEYGLGLETIVCAGPLDTKGFDKQKAGSKVPGGEEVQWQNALGNNPDYMAETSATSLIQPGIGIPPMIGVVRGTPERQRIEVDFLAELVSVGINATTIDARALSHSEVNSQIGASSDGVMTQPIVAFLSECFK